MYNTIAAIKRANKASGQYWFSPSTMRFFNSEIETNVLYGRYFITSERMNLDMPKQYSIRCVEEDCGIDTIGKRGEFSTKNDAIAYLDKLINAEEDARESYSPCK
jgi:hypothetical protein